MPNCDIRFELEAHAYSLGCVADQTAKSQCLSVLKNTVDYRYKKRAKAHAIESQGQARDFAIEMQNMNTATQISLLHEIVRYWFKCLEVFADYGIELSNEQLAIVYEFWAANLYSVLPDPNVYSLAAESIEREFGLVYKGKIHDILLGRRFGKSFSMLLALCCMVAVSPAFKCCVLNLFGHAGRTNYDYAVGFLTKLRDDPKQRIRCNLIRTGSGMFVEVKSHYQTIAEEYRNATGKRYWIDTAPSNTLHSFPDMTKDDGAVRDFLFLFKSLDLKERIDAATRASKVRRVSELASAWVWRRNTATAE